MRTAVAYKLQRRFFEKRFFWSKPKWQKWKTLATYYNRSAAEAVAEHYLKVMNPNAIGLEYRLEEFDD